MSILAPEIHQALGQLLQGLSSADNVTRTFAEEQLNNEWVIGRPAVLLIGLVEQIQISQEPSVHEEPHFMARGVILIVCTCTDAVVRSCPVPPHELEVKEATGYGGLERIVLDDTAATERCHQTKAAGMFTTRDAAPSKAQNWRRRCRDRKTILRQR